MIILFLQTMIYKKYNPEIEQYFCDLNNKAWIL